MLFWLYFLSSSPLSIPPRLQVLFHLLHTLTTDHNFISEHHSPCRLQPGLICQTVDHWCTHTSPMSRCPHTCLAPSMHLLPFLTSSDSTTVPIMSFRSTKTQCNSWPSQYFSVNAFKANIASAVLFLYFPIHFTLSITLFALVMKLWRLCDEYIQLSYIKLQSEDISLIFSLVSGCCLVLNI